MVCLLRGTRNEISEPFFKSTFEKEELKMVSYIYIRLFGGLALLCLIVAAVLGHFVMKGKVKVKWHAILASLAIFFGLIHLLLIYI